MGRNLIGGGTMDLFDIVAAKKLSGGGGTPVGTLTVEGTLRQPFGNIAYTVVRDALKNNLGSALLTVTMNGDTSTVPLFVQNNAIILNGTMTTRSNGNIIGFQTYIAGWLGQIISEFRIIAGNNGTWSADDYKSLANNFPTTLTFTYWGD